jgi:hypothetical protein
MAIGLTLRQAIKGLDQDNLESAVSCISDETRVG